MKKWSRVFGILSAVLVLSSSLAGAGGGDSTKQSYLVGMNNGLSAASLRAQGLDVASVWNNINAGQVWMTASQARALANNPNISYIENDNKVEALGHGTLPFADGALTWGLQAVHAQEAWNQGDTGANRKVCILDTGITYTHPEFYRGGVSIIIGSGNFTGDGHPDATDGHGHGTHVAGTIAGQLNASGSKIGVATGVNLLIARVLDDSGSGTNSSVINGLNWCVAQGANITSASLGSSMSSQAESQAFQSAYNAGVLNVAASGNDGTNRISYPANYTSVIAVGALNPDLTLASFSNYGKNQELVAPGVDTLSAQPFGMGSTSSVTEAGVGYASNGLEFAPNGNVSGQLVECGLADTTTSCGTVPGGTWIAMISRGTIAFADKVNNVIAQGASAAIIANNDTALPNDKGNFTLGSASTGWIPTASVSYNSGVAIRNGGLGTGNVTLAPWDYAYYNGTSMATPHVSAVAAVAWGAKTTLTNAQIRSILQTTAQDLGAAGKDNSYGYGLVRADLAANQARNTP